MQVFHYPTLSKHFLLVTLLLSLNILNFPLALRYKKRVSILVVTGFISLFSRVWESKMNIYDLRRTQKCDGDDDEYRFLTDTVNENSRLFFILYICDLESHNLKPLYLFWFTTCTWSVEALTHEIQVWWLYKDNLLWT